MIFLHYLLIALEVVLVFNLIIGVHELGHFLAARWRGLKVERFAIWFGKPIWKKKIGDVEYALGWIPAGGYVSLPQMATMEMIEGKSEPSETKVTTNYGASVWTTTETSEGKPTEVTEPLPNVSPLDKIIVAFAGPLFSFLLAIVFAVVVWQVGKPSNEFDNSTVIGWADPSGPAWQAGLRPGDEIKEVDGHPVHHFSPVASMTDSVTWCVITSTGTNIPVKYVRNGQEAMAYPVPFHFQTKWYERKALRKILVGPTGKATIFQVATNSPAALAGLKPDDEVVAINGQKIYSYVAVLSAQEAMSNNVLPLTLTVRRRAEQFDRTLLAVKPLQPTNATPLLGIMAWAVDTNVTLIHPTPMQQIQDSAGQIFHTFGALFNHKGEIGVQQLGGAVMIIRVYSNLFESDDGWLRVLWFSVVLNVNLAMLNMLPLPMLDGGHITLSIIDVIRRRPSSPKVLNYIQNGFAILLISLMAYLAFFDIGDWVRSSRADREVPVIFAAPK